MYIEPPHFPQDRIKTARMIKSLRAGKSLPPILIHGEQAYSGSHRIEAYKIMDMEIDYVELDDSQFDKIMAELGLDTMYDTVSDFEPFIDAAHSFGYALNAK